MKILGRVVIGEGRNRLLRQDAVIEIDRVNFRQHAKGVAHIGDLIWVQEPFWLLYNTQGPHRQETIVVAPMGPLKDPPRHLRMDSCVQSRMPARYLSRRNSRATLEIMGIMADSAGVRCQVHMSQVDDFAKTRRAAA